jgi:hypothetical protein
MLQALGRREIHAVSWPENVKGRGQLEDRDIIMEWMLKE